MVCRSVAMFHPFLWVGCQLKLHAHSIYKGSVFHICENGSKNGLISVTVESAERAVSHYINESEGSHEVDVMLSSQYIGYFVYCCEQACN